MHYCKWEKQAITFTDDSFSVNTLWCTLVPFDACTHFKGLGIFQKLSFLFEKNRCIIYWEEIIITYEIYFFWKNKTLRFKTQHTTLYTYGKCIEKKVTEKKWNGLTMQVQNLAAMQIFFIVPPRLDLFANCNFTSLTFYLRNSEAAYSSVFPL